MTSGEGAVAPGQVILVIGVVWLLLGAVFVGVGRWRTRRAAGWVPVPGVLTDADGYLDGLPQRRASFRWPGPDGRWHRATSAVRGGGLNRPGTPVTVRVDPTDPSRGQLEGLFQSGYGFTIIGCGLALVGTALLVSGLLGR